MPVIGVAITLNACHRRGYHIKCLSEAWLSHQMPAIGVAITSNACHRRGNHIKCLS